MLVGGPGQIFRHAYPTKSASDCSNADPVDDADLVGEVDVREARSPTPERIPTSSYPDPRGTSWANAAGDT